MQDQYTGDVGDFGKYGLLRFLFPPPARLGIVWWLYPNESHKSDGRHVAYLDRPDFRACDPELFDQLKQIVESKRRNVAEIECRRLLDNSVFFSDVVGSGPRRETWLESALAATANCDAVFLDPDNGLEIASCDRASRASGKYVYLDEIAAFAKRPQTLVIYHHLCRRGPHVEQIRHRARQLEQFGELTALRFRSYSVRAYFLISNQKLSTDAFLATPWRSHFDRVL